MDILRIKDIYNLTIYKHNYSNQNPHECCSFKIKRNKSFKISYILKEGVRMIDIINSSKYIYNAKARVTLSITYAKLSIRMRLQQHITQF